MRFVGVLGLLFLMGCEEFQKKSWLDDVKPIYSARGSHEHGSWMES